MWYRRDHLLSPSEGRFLECTPTFGFGHSDQEAIYSGLTSLDIRDYWKFGRKVHPGPTSCGAISHGRKVPIPVFA